MAEYIERDMFLKIISHKPSSPTTDREDRLINGFISAVKNCPAADVRPVKWIPVTDRLPQETQRCIVVSKCGEMAFAIYKGNGFQYPHYMGKATHWMPLPEPPKEE